MPPYDLRHAYASLQIRAGVSIPELAERLGHSPQMTVSTYTHVIRELEGEPRVSAGRRSSRRAMLVDARWTSQHKPEHGSRSDAPICRNGEGQNRTGDTTIFSAAREE